MIEYTLVAIDTHTYNKFKTNPGVTFKEGNQYHAEKISDNAYAVENNDDPLNRSLLALYESDITQHFKIL